MNVFVDGIVFGRQRFGGISRVWAKYIEGLLASGVSMRLLIPIIHSNSILRGLLQGIASRDVRRDCFYWPARWFDNPRLRSAILRSVYVPEGVEIFHSTYLSTVYDRRLKNVVTIHDMIPEIFQDEFGNRWLEKLIRLKADVLRNADRVTCVSATTKDDLLRHHPWLPEENVAVVPNGFSRDDFMSDVPFDSVAARYGLRIRPHEYFMFVGRRDGYKNFEALVRLVSLFPRWRESVFVCVGGEEDRAVRQRIDRAGLGRNFIFVEYLADHELGVLYRNSLALVNPSLYEGFSLPLVEAMGCDCLVVCSDTPSLRETAGDAGVYFDPRTPDSLDEALGRILTADRHALIQKGKARAGKYSWEATVHGILDVYRGLV